MIKMQVKYQERYSRVELLARNLLGFFYIVLPHTFILSFLAIWSQIISFISFFVILFTGRYPESFFEFNVQYLRWNWRVNARIFNLCDGYPAFGLDAQDEYTVFEVEYPQQFDRVHALIKFLFGWLYCVLPHAFILMFRGIATQFLVFIGFWAILFTGECPQFIHDFNVGTMRWSTRLNLYLMFMTDQYPPFSGKELGGNTASNVLDMPVEK